MEKLKTNFFLNKSATNYFNLTKMKKKKNQSTCSSPCKNQMVLVLQYAER